ncbi:MAG: hypothetical protein HYZ86_04385 [Candidatus Omnitrophica bacterium]|nr:hypothetical protein [Candidatus Omnitrophota bacterium]
MDLKGLKTHLLRNKHVISFQDYDQLREDYVRDKKYLRLFGMSPRVFGQIWGEEHLKEMSPRLEQASKKLDNHYEGEYDLWLDGIKIEAKACRAINTKIRGDLVSKALSYSSKDPFWMNFQQLKPDACHVFVFIGVWIDRIVYWVMSRDEVKKSPYLSHQHRGGIEFQIGVTEKNIKSFDKYKTKQEYVIKTILLKARGD